MKQKEAAITLLTDLIKFESINNPSEKVYPEPDVVKYVQDTLLSWNPEYKSKIFNKDHYTSIYISSDLNSPKDVLFLGHLDVVPVTTNWDSNPFEFMIRNQTLGFGRGAKDCKGSIVSALLFLKEINENSDNKSLVDRIGLFLSTDEESGGQFGAKKFFQYAKKSHFLPRYVINVDGGPKVVYKRRAGFNLRLKASPLRKEIKSVALEKSFITQVMYDNNRHSAYFVPGVDSHALLQLSKFLHLNPHTKIKELTGEWIKGNVIPNKVRTTILNPNTELGEEQIHTYDANLTKIIRLLRSLVQIHIPTEFLSDFGITVNPNLCKYSPTEGTEIQFDIRAFLAPEDNDRLTHAFSNRLDSFSGQVHIECSGSSGYFFTDLSSPLVTTSTKVMRQFLLMEEDESPREQEGASDARYATTFGVPAIDIGPRGGNIHGDNEYVDLESLIQFSTIYKNIVTNLLTSDRVLN